MVWRTTDNIWRVWPKDHLLQQFYCLQAYGLYRLFPLLLAIRNCKHMVRNYFQSNGWLVVVKFGIKESLSSFEAIRHCLKVITIPYHFTGHFPSYSWRSLNSFLLSPNWTALKPSQFSRPYHSNTDFPPCYCRCNSSKKHPIIRIP